MAALLGLLVGHAPAPSGARHPERVVCARTGALGCWLGAGDTGHWRGAGNGASWPFRSNLRDGQSSRGCKRQRWLGAGNRASWNGWLLAGEPAMGRSLRNSPPRHCCSMLRRLSRAHRVHSGPTSSMASSPAKASGIAPGGGSGGQKPNTPAGNLSRPSHLPNMMAP